MVQSTDISVKQTFKHVTNGRAFRARLTKLSIAKPESSRDNSSGYQSTQTLHCHSENQTPDAMHFPTPSSTALVFLHNSQ